MIYTSRHSKKTLLAHIHELERENKYLQEEYISPDCVEDLVDSAILEERNRNFRELQKRDPETHRANFQLIHGEAS